MLRAATHVAYTEVLRHNLLYGLCLQAVLADAIHHRPHRVQLEMMLAEEMCLQLLDFLAMKMDELAADLALAMVAGRLLICTARSISCLALNQLIAGRRCRINRILRDCSFLRQPVKKPVQRRHPDVRATFDKMRVNFLHRHMLPWNRLKPRTQLIIMLRFIISTGTSHPAHLQVKEYVPLCIRIYAYYSKSYSRISKIT